MERLHGIRRHQELQKLVSLTIIKLSTMVLIGILNLLLHILLQLRHDSASGRTLLPHHHLHHQEITLSQILVRIVISKQQRHMLQLLRVLLDMLCKLHSLNQRSLQEIISCQALDKISILRIHFSMQESPNLSSESMLVRKRIHHPETTLFPISAKTLMSNQLRLILPLLKSNGDIP